MQPHFVPKHLWYLFDKPYQIIVSEKQNLITCIFNEDYLRVVTITNV